MSEENLADEEKEEKEKEDDKDLVEAEPLPPVSKSTSNSKRKKISLAISSWSSSISFLNRPLSIVELERIEVGDVRGILSQFLADTFLMSSYFHDLF